MRCKNGSTVLVTITDGTAVRGRVTRSWRWHVVRLLEAYAISPQGQTSIAGSLLIPHRSILVVQEES